MNESNAVKAARLRQALHDVQYNGVPMTLEEAGRIQADINALENPTPVETSLVYVNPTASAVTSTRYKKATK